MSSRSQPSAAVAPVDLSLLDDDDMAEIGAVMTRVELKRFTAAIAAGKE